MDLSFLTILITIFCFEDHTGAALLKSSHIYDMDHFEEYNNDAHADSIAYEAEKVDPDFTDMDISNESCDLLSLFIALVALMTWVGWATSLGSEITTKRVVSESYSKFQ